MNVHRLGNAFALSLVAFVAANCASYFVRSDCGTLLNNMIEGIGTPCLVWLHNHFESFRPSMEVHWDGLVKNVLAAVVCSCVLALVYSERLPLLWNRRSARMQYSLRSLFVLTTCVAVLIGVALWEGNRPRAVYDAVRFVGPVALSAALVGSRCGSWLRLLAGATGLFVLSVILDPRWSLSGIMQDPEFYAFESGQMIVQAFVPVFGLLSVLVLGHTVYLMIPWDKVSDGLRAWWSREHETECGESRLNEPVDEGASDADAERVNLIETPACRN